MIVPTFQKGAQLSAADLNLAMDAVRRARVLPGVGVKLTETLNGTVVSLKSQRASSGGPDSIEPWDIIELAGVGTPNSQGEFANFKARVSPGLLCGILPSNWDAEFTFSGTGLVYAVAKIQTDGTAINALEIAITSTAPAQQTPEKWKLPTSVDYLFAVIFEGSVKRTIGAGNITIAPKVWITVPKATAVGPGEIAYDRYYILA
jgi:hypothetical protein